MALAKSLLGYNNVAITELGLYISDTAVFSNQQTLPFTPQIVSPAGVYLSDTVNWTEISGTYIAHGGEKYITLGNFNTHTDTIGVVYHNNYSASYYFIDDVTVRDCTNDGVEEIAEDKMHFNLYPNPNNGNMVLEYQIQTNDSGVLSIYDVSGRLVNQKTLNSANNKVNIDATSLNAGAYYYNILVNGNKVKADKLIILK